MHFDLIKIKKLIPYFGSLLVVCGYVKLSIFYSHFNIQISQYLEITEIFTLFLRDVLFYAGILFFTYLFLWIAEPQMESENRTKKQEEIINTDKFLVRLISIAKMQLALLFIVLMYILAGIVAYIWKPAVFYSFVVVGSFFFLIALYPFMVFEFKRKYYLVYKQKVDATYSNLLLVIVMFFLAVLQNTFLEIKRVEENDNLFVSFEYLERSFESGSKFIFLGQTKNYVFIYNQENEETSVFPRKDLTNFTVRKYWY